MKLTASKVGRMLSRSGFQSSYRGTRDGFRCQNLTSSIVAVTADFRSTAREIAALRKYADILSAAGMTVDNQTTTLFIELA